MLIPYNGLYINIIAIFLLQIFTTFCSKTEKNYKKIEKLEEFQKLLNSQEIRAMTGIYRYRKYMLIVFGGQIGLISTLVI